MVVFTTHCLYWVAVLGRGATLLRMALKEGKIRKYISFSESELAVFLQVAHEEGFEVHQFSQFVNRCCRERVNRTRGIASVDRPVA